MITSVLRFEEKPPNSEELIENILKVFYSHNVIGDDSTVRILENKGSYEVVIAVDALLTLGALAAGGVIAKGFLSQTGKNLSDKIFKGKESNMI